MGSNNQEETVAGINFLYDPDARQLFAGIDYALKNGKHIQRWKEDESLFGFIEKHFIDLQAYYGNYFGVLLESGGESNEKYYYLEFLPKSRGGIPEENRSFLPNEFVIVGFMLYKIVFIDHCLELNSLTALQKMIRQDYEDLKPGIYRALAKAKKLNTTQMDDHKANEMIEKALREFAKLGWIDFDGSTFDILPSFQRLVKIYGDYINNPDMWLNPINEK